MSTNPKAYPLASEQLSKQIIDLVSQASNLNQIKRGANESTKALNKNKAAFVILAADAEPLEIVLHLPLLCEDKNTPYVFVPSRNVLGRAAGVTRPMVSVAILNIEGSQLASQVETIRNEIDKLFV
ncbi:Ribosomal protein L7Ae/L8/Nhp2 family [Carpediemonas membranifera]|uniref:H/ACA ribonucleoprotein complex subunit 2 n=1 Tax=Carpediemonas membranifera TaxID=201153 RepID=A0A8J6AQB0_9EUKA|nr:Ribosomal protein L7Ae/L8/Nhp2 family [Carpediemonas membranifera]|eukprot:KAG9390793.1 Ribosomal protein L7Ae/L8/Nhp2 family [Carpediemonas membranifera]